jgi:hypothetical protein
MAFAPPAFADGDIDHTIDIVRGMTFNEDLEHPVIINGPPGIVSFNALPTRAFESTTQVRSIIDYMDSVDGLDVNHVHHLLNTRQYNELPDILKPRTMLPREVKMQMVILPNPDGTHKVLKHFTFERIHVAVARSLCHGQDLEMKLLSVNPQLSKKAFSGCLNRWVVSVCCGRRFCRPPKRRT